MLRLSSASVLAVLAVLAALAAHARADGPSVRLDLTHCPAVDAVTVRRVVNLELRIEVESADVDTTVVVVRCMAETSEIVVTDPITGKTVSRRIAVGLGPVDTQARLLGVAIVELVIASWSELESVPEPRTPPVDRTASPTTTRAARKLVRPRLSHPPRRLPSADATVVGIARIGHTSLGLSAGAGIRWSAELSRAYGWNADFAVMRAATVTTTGEVAAEGATASATFHRRVLRGPVSATAGGGARLGFYRFAGTPADTDAAIGRSFTAPSGGPLAELAFVFRPVDAVAVVAIAEAGYRLVGARARVGAEDTVALDGAWLTLSAGAGWSW